MEEEKKKKALYERWWFWIIVVFIIIIGIIIRITYGTETLETNLNQEITEGKITYYISNKWKIKENSKEGNIYKYYYPNQNTMIMLMISKMDIYIDDENINDALDGYVKGLNLDTDDLISQDIKEINGNKYGYVRFFKYSNDKKYEVISYFTFNGNEAYVFMFGEKYKINDKFINLANNMIYKTSIVKETEEEKQARLEKERLEKEQQEAEEKAKKEQEEKTFKESCQTYTFEQMARNPDNFKGTNVKVTILRDGKEIELDVQRKKINVEHVSSQMLENNIAYVQIDSFDSGVAESFKNQITELRNGGATKIIIDVRSNGGGIVTEATEIAELFLEKGETILITKGKKDKEELTTSEKDPIIKDIPVVVLVNEGTASASEILAGALKDKYENTTIVGKTTYGKGVIQTLYNLSDGSGLKITTEEYYTPNHKKINKEGIKPDVEVDLTKDANGYYETGIDKDAQLLKAIEILKK